jgi:hypothetical protein
MRWRIWLAFRVDVCLLEEGNGLVEFAPGTRLLFAWFIAGVGCGAESEEVLRCWPSQSGSVGRWRQGAMSGISAGNVRCQPNA